MPCRSRNCSLSSNREDRMVRLRVALALLIIAVIPVSAPAQEKPKIYFGASSKTLGYGPLWAAVKKGFLEQQGLDGQLVLLRGTPRSEEHTSELQSQSNLVCRLLL